MLRLLEAPWAIGAKVGWYTGLRVSWSEEDAKSWIYTIFEVCHGVMVSWCHSLLYTGLWSAVSNRWPGKMDCWTTGGWILFLFFLNVFCRGHVQHIFCSHFFGDSKFSCRWLVVWIGRCGLQFRCDTVTSTVIFARMADITVFSGNMIVFLKPHIGPHIGWTLRSILMVGSNA